MQKENNTNQQKRPRRSRMPKVVYDTASTVRRRLTHWKVTAITKEEELPDEQLCSAIVQPLRNISSLVFYKELDPEINEHPHNSPYECEHIITEAMRLAYGIQDLIDAGKRVSKVDRALCAELFDYFKKIKKAADESDEKWRERVRGNKSYQTQQNKPTPQGCFTIEAAFDWPYFGIHRQDTLTVKEDGQIKVGKPALVQREDEDGYFLVRICSIKADAIRIASFCGDVDDIKPADVVGAVIEINHAECNQTKIEALRQRLSELQEDDEHTLNYTKCFEVEEQIYNLEHPPEEDEEDEDFEWPEVIGDE